MCVCIYIHNLYTQLFLDICEGLFPGVPTYTKVRGCSSPLYKVAYYSRASVSAGRKPVDTGGQLHTKCTSYLYILLRFVCNLLNYSFNKRIQEAW